MKWEKKGSLFNFSGNNSWACAGAMIPTPDIEAAKLRFYVSVCDNEGRARITALDAADGDVARLQFKATQPFFDLGLPGTFDDNGMVATSIVTLPNGQKYLYYVGFELGVKIRYRLFTGLAISNDSGKTFCKYSSVPILDRSSGEKYFRCGPYVQLENGIFRMWYVGGDDWTVIDGKECPVYVIKYLESRDGIHWGAEGKNCIPILYENEHGFGRPYVIRHEGIYKMFYSKRIRHLGYRLGYAESKDGIDWERKDDSLNLDVSAQGWDAEMICYPAVADIKGRLCMFYNGNGFGSSGFGWAELKAW